jgi:hypothetical protein
VGQYHGDGMLVYFGYPKSREDSAVLGVSAGLGILREIENLNAKFAREGRAPLNVRIGLHTGLLVVGELGSGDGRESSVVVGKTPNLAARLQTLARAGSVVISGDTWRLVRPFFRCEPLGESLLKGIPDPVAIYEVISEISSPHVAVNLTSLIGRDAELSALRAAWTSVSAGSGARLTVLGEAGIGKSRLVQEFRMSISTAPHQCLVASGSSQAQSSAFDSSTLAAASSTAIHHGLRCALPILWTYYCIELFPKMEWRIALGAEAYDPCGVAPEIEFCQPLALTVGSRCSRSALPGGGNQPHGSLPRAPKPHVEDVFSIWRNDTSTAILWLHPGRIGGAKCVRRPPAVSMV